MMVVLRSSRSCTGTLPLKPSPVSESVLKPPTTAVFCASADGGEAEVHAGLVNNAMVDGG